MLAGRAPTADDFCVPCLGLAIIGAAAVLVPAAAHAVLPTVALVLGLLCLRIVWQDLTDFTIPDSASLALGLVGAAWRLHEATSGNSLVLDAALIALDGALCGGALLLLRELFYLSRGHDGLGLGDVKLAAAGGLLVGTIGFAWTLFAASLIGILVLMGRRLRHALPGASVEAEPRLAFGAVLAPALWLAWLAAALGLP